MRTQTGIGIVAVALVAVAAAYVIGRGGLSSQPLGPRDGHDLPAIDLERVAVGMEAPDFSLRSLAGDAVTLSDYRGHQSVLLVFYRGHW